MNIILNCWLVDFCQLQTANGCVIVSLKKLECPCSLFPPKWKTYMFWYWKLSLISILVSKIRHSTFKEGGPKELMEEDQCIKPTYIEKTALDLFSSKEGRKNGSPMLLSKRAWLKSFFPGNFSKLALLILSNVTSLWTL